MRWQRSMRLQAVIVSFLIALPAFAASADTDSVHFIKDITYQTVEPAERADVYLPAASANKPWPAVIWMHGDGHDKADARERNNCRQLALAGFVGISINYGSWPDTDAGEEHSPRILQNIANARNAIRFFRSHADRFSIDPDRIALFGGSAGAWLALMVGTTDGDSQFDSTAPYPGVSSAVCAIGDFYADLDPWLKSRDLSRSPPVLIVHGKADPAVDYHDSIQLSQMLTDLHVPNELILLDHVGHAFDFTTWRNKPLPRDLRPIVFDFLKRYLVARKADSP